MVDNKNENNHTGKKLFGITNNEDLDEQQPAKNFQCDICNFVVREKE